MPDDQYPAVQPPGIQALQDLVPTLTWLITTLAVILCLLLAARAAHRALIDGRAPRPRRAPRPAPPTPAEIRADIDRNHQAVGLPLIPWPVDLDADAAGQPQLRGHRPRPAPVLSDHAPSLPTTTHQEDA